MLRVVAVLVFLLLAPPIEAQHSDLTESAWNSGAVTFKMEKGTSRTSGQGYLVARKDGIWIYTIGHVVDKASKVEIHIPGLWPEGLFQEIAIQRFGCDNSEGGADTDPSCFFKVRTPLSDSILAGNEPLLPYVRAVPDSAGKGFVGVPLPDTNRQWAIYGVSSIAPGQVKIRSVGIDENADGRADRQLGDLCQGNSGSPLVLLKREGLGFVPVLTPDGYAISIGELEAGYTNSAFPDRRGRNRNCFLNMVANHPGRSSTEPAIQHVELVLEE